MTEINIIYSTTSNKNTTYEIAHALSENDIILCVNIVSDKINDTSDVQCTNQHTILVKTFVTHLEEAINIIKDMHKNDIPSIKVLPIKGSHDLFHSWIMLQLAQSKNKEIERYKT